MSIGIIKQAKLLRFTHTPDASLRLQGKEKRQQPQGVTENEFVYGNLFYRSQSQYW
jgi:hypothetical protein